MGKRVCLFIFPVRFTSIAPIDLAYLSAYLKSRGHEVCAHDFNVELPVSNDSDTRFWDQTKNQEELFHRNYEIAEGWVADILDFAPHIIGISVWESQQYFSLEIAKMIKNKAKEIQIVIGGPWCSINSRMRDFINNGCVDYVVFGEGEVTFGEIVESGDSAGPIPGCFKKRDGEILVGDWRKQITKPDSLPFPDYTHFSFDKYILSLTYPILFTRGCNWNCSFCTHRMIWKKFRSRSAENIFAEMQHCFLKHPFIKKFRSCDHAMNANMGELLKLCDLMINHNIKIDEIEGFGQVNSYMLDENVLKKLKRAGFTNWGIGMQTGSDRILKSMRRPYTAAEAEKMLKAMYNLGINSSIDIIIGYPEETEDDFKQSLEFVSRVSHYVGNIAVTPHCYVDSNDLAFYPEKYGIYALNGGGDNWESVCNTPSIRLKRYETMLDHLSSLGVSHRYSDSDRDYFSKAMQEIKNSKSL